MAARPTISEFTGLPAPNVADSCRITIDRRFLLEEKPADVRQKSSILDRLEGERQKFDYEIRDMWKSSPP
jgi:succinyl-diaminopimelate desuccinylase